MRTIFAILLSLGTIGTCLGQGVVDWESSPSAWFIAQTNGFQFYGGGFAGGSVGNTAPASSGLAYYFELLYNTNFTGSQVPTPDYTTLFGGTWLDTGLTATNSNGARAGSGWRTPTPPRWCHGIGPPRIISCSLAGRPIWAPLGYRFPTSSQIGMLAILHLSQVLHSLANQRRVILRRTLRRKLVPSYFSPCRIPTACQFTILPVRRCSCIFWAIPFQVPSLRHWLWRVWALCPCCFCAAANSAWFPSEGKGSIVM